MSVRVVRLGTPRIPREGTRIGTAAPGAKHDLELLAALSHATDFSVGCYCEDEAHCHRSILKQLLVENGARVE